MTCETRSSGKSPNEACGSSTRYPAPGLNSIVTEDQPGRIKPGDIYEDCSFHPVLCTFADGDEIEGISLIDATTPRACSVGHCGVIKLSVADVIAARADWPAYLARRMAGVSDTDG
jgi:hypothetical protein